MGDKKDLSICEEMVMSVIWSSKEDLTLNQVTERLKSRHGKDYAIQTVATFLTRLEKKKYISIYRVGRYSHYHPEVSRETHIQERLTEVRDILFDGDWYEMADAVKKMIKAELEE